MTHAAYCVAWQSRNIGTPDGDFVLISVTDK